MADITLTCDACGTTLTLSEYAKPANLTCHKCGKALGMPNAEKNSTATLLPERIRRAKAEAQAALEGHPPEKDVVLTDISKNIHNRQKRRARAELLVPTIKAIVLFVILTLLMGYIRYSSLLAPYVNEKLLLFLPDDTMETVRFTGFLAVLFFHLVIVIEAMTDQFLNGLLCLLVPGYSLYYLFTSSDSFLLRAIMLSLVIVFGYDFALYVHGYAMDFYTFVKAWLDAGGTPEPTTRLK